MMATLLTPSRSMSVCMAAVKMVAHFRSGKHEAGVVIWSYGWVSPGGLSRRLLARFRR
jgi:hypothetical protein